MSAGSEQAKKPPNADGNNGPSPIDWMMREMGATRWDPTPVDQHDFFLDAVPGESALQRALAWMRAHTIRRGRWKAYAVDEKGNELRVEHLAADLGWKVKWAQQVWRLGERYGLFRREKQYPSRLYLSGKVIRLISNSESNGCSEPSRCTMASSPPVLPGYLERQIAKWEPDRRAAFLARLQRMEQRERELQREAMAAVRAIVDQHKDSLFAEFGLQKMQGAKRREPRKKAIVTVTINEEGQAGLLAAAGAATNGASPGVVQPPPKPDVPPPTTVIVQTPAEIGVQGGLYNEISASVQRSEAAVHQPQNGTQVTADPADEPAEGPPTLRTLETTREEADPSSSSSVGDVGEGQGSTTTTALTHEAEENAGPERVALVIAKVTTPDDTLVRNLVAACRKVDPTATYEEIAHFVGVKLDQALSMRSVRNLPGFLLTAVSRCFEKMSLAAHRREARELVEAAAKKQRRREAEMEQFRQEQQAVLNDPGFGARTAVAARDGGSPGPCQHCSGIGYLLVDTGTEQVAGEERKTIAASPCDCSKGRETGFGRLAAIERAEAKRRGPGWIAAHRPSDHAANGATQTAAASLRL